MLLKEYPFVCPVCGTIQHAEPSVNMKLGINSGHAVCSNTNCNEMLHLEINENGEFMDAEAWEEYVDRIRLTNNDVRFFEHLIQSA